MMKNKTEIEKKNNDTIKENEKLQTKIQQLTLLHDDLEEQLDSMSVKYRDIKKILNEKEKELSDLKEASQALIQKEKKQIEQLDSIEPEKTKIISDKKYKKLTWYLIYEKNKNKNNTQDGEDEENKYENYRWVNGAILKKNKLEKFNKYESDEEKIKELNEYVLKLQKKLEEKEESYSKLDYQNKKLIKEIHNKTAGEGLVRHHSKGNNGQAKNTSIELGNAGFKNILEELNNSNAREKQLQNKIINLNNQLKDANKNETKNEINDNNDNMNLEQAQEQIILLKEELKETKTKLEQLIGQVKELLKNVKCDNKNKPQFVQICQILNLSPKTTNRIITNNNKKGIVF
jgi:hypothetical protein